MTPEEAKPHVFRYAATQGQPGDVQLEKETGERMPIGTPFFTAKETAEIAQTYCRDYINSTVPYQKGTVHLRKAIAWKNLFEGWSK